MITISVLLFVVCLLGMGLLGVLTGYPLGREYGRFRGYLAGAKAGWDNHAEHVAECKLRREKYDARLSQEPGDE